ncbi:DUF2892 domain-containing protein [Streptomyces caeni]|uniref:DUF2892 domain-containing protein n=1 Tax=Streptomyces caeni TaxID=2307231 RepID=A0ABW4J1M5_9ACTN
MLNFLGSQNGRAVRAILGVAFIVIGATLGGAWWALAVVGLLPLATAILDVCLVAGLAGRPVSGKALRAGR